MTRIGEVRIMTSWIDPEQSFEDKDALFTKFKIVIRVHNLWKMYNENKDTKGGPPHLKKLPIDKGSEDTRRCGRHTLVRSQQGRESLRQDSREFGY